MRLGDSREEGSLMLACAQAGATDCPGTSQQGGGEPREQSPSSVPRDPPAEPSREGGESYVLTSLRTRCKEAERQLTVVRAPLMWRNRKRNWRPNEKIS